jgi:transcriptional regulator with PAS, ATPase and Fis domain
MGAILFIPILKKTNDGLEIIYSNHEPNTRPVPNDPPIIEVAHHEDESLSLQDKEIDLIKKALEKHHGKRKKAAKELGISERTLYRKIKQYNL